MKPEQIAEILIIASRAFDAAMRRLNPIALAEIRKSLLVHLDPLQEARRFMSDDGLDGGDQKVRAGLLLACDFLQHAIRNFADEEDLQAAYISALRAARKHCRALSALYPLCGTFPEVDRYFLEPGSGRPPASSGQIVMKVKRCMNQCRLYSVLHIIHENGEVIPSTFRKTIRRIIPGRWWWPCTADTATGGILSGRGLPRPGAAALSFSLRRRRP